MRIIFISIVSGIIILSLVPSMLAGEVSFTQDDRDRLIRLETKAEEGQKSLQRQIEEGQKSLQRQIEEGQKSLQRQIDDLKNSLQKQVDDLRVFMLWGFGILFGGMGILIGFVIWDRRTAIAPVAARARELEEREELVEKALKEYANVEPKLAEILKSLRLM